MLALLLSLLVDKLIRDFRNALSLAIYFHVWCVTLIATGEESKLESVSKKTVGLIKYARKVESWAIKALFISNPSTKFFLVSWQPGNVLKCIYFFPYNFSIRVLLG